MREAGRLGTSFTGAAWLLFGAVLVSFTHSPEAGDACHPQAMWTGGWFFAPPPVALLSLALTLRRSPHRTDFLETSGYGPHSRFFLCEFYLTDNQHQDGPALYVVSGDGHRWENPCTYSEEGGNCEPPRQTNIRWRRLLIADSRSSSYRQ